MSELVSVAPPGLQPLKRLVLDAVRSPHSRRAYGKALDDFLAWYGTGRGAFGRAMVQAYRAELERRGLAPSTVNVRLAAVRKLAAEAAENGLLDPAAAAAIARVRGVPRRGVRAGNWLTREETGRLLQAPDPATLQGLRDRALLALLAGCGLRRAEAAALTFEHIQQRDGRWAIVDLSGKHGRVRSVPMPGWAKAAVDRWAKAAGIRSGAVLRPVNKAGRLCGSVITPQAVFAVVVAAGAAAGLRVTPHDLRRTFAKLAHGGRAALEQIQLSLGHASILTTERYLGVRQDFRDAPCDRLGINGLP